MDQINNGDDDHVLLNVKLYTPFTVLVYSLTLYPLSVYRWSCVTVIQELCIKVLKYSCLDN